jgi:hypothetical protein
MLYVGARVLNDTISTALSGIKFDEKYARTAANWLILN